MESLLLNYLAFFTFQTHLLVKDGPLFLLDLNGDPGKDSVLGFLVDVLVMLGFFIWDGRTVGLTCSSPL